MSSAVRSRWKPRSDAWLAAEAQSLRHTPEQGADAVFRSDPLEVDLAARVTRKNGQEVKLTPTEYALLPLQVVHAG